MSVDAVSPTSRFRPWLRQAAAVAGYGVVILLILRGVDSDRLLQALTKLRVGHVAILISCIAFHLTLRALRYHTLVLRTHPTGYRLADGLRIFMVGIGAALVTPARAGDVVKAELLRPYGVRRATGLGLVLIERILDLLVIAATVVVAGAVMARHVHSSEMRFGAGILLLGLVVGTVIVTLRRPRELVVRNLAGLLERLSKRVRRERMEEICHRVFDVWDEVFSSPVTLAKYLAASSILWFADFFKLWIILRASDSDVSLLAVLFVYPLSLVIGVISLLPFGEGVVGVTAVALLHALAKVDIESATAAVIFDRAASTLAPALAYAILCAHRAIGGLRRSRSGIATAASKQEGLATSG